MLNQLSLQPDFLERGFGFISEGKANGEQLTAQNYLHKFAFKVIECQLWQLVDADLLLYIDGNTQNLFGIENAAPQTIFTGDNLVDELISLLFDPLQANQTLAA